MSTTMTLVLLYIFCFLGSATAILGLTTGWKIWQVFTIAACVGSAFVTLCILAEVWTSLTA